MSNPDYIPRKDEDFDIWQRNFALQLTAGNPSLATRLGIPTAKIDLLDNLQGLWGSTFQLASQPATRTPLAVEQKNHARDNYEAHIRALVRQYITNSDGTTDEDRVSLGLPIPKTTRTRVPIPTDAPAFDIDVSHIREIHIHYHLLGGKPDSAKAYGTHGVECGWAILDHPPSDDIDTELVHSKFDTHSPLILTFKEGLRGKTVYFALRWENTRGEKGPWSAVASVIIP